MVLAREHKGKVARNLPTYVGRGGRELAMDGGALGSNPSLCNPTSRMEMKDDLARARLFTTTLSWQLAVYDVSCVNVS